MPSSALYFPYINVPNTKWFVRTLLYWDKVSSIVPYDYVHEREQLDPHMQSLASAGLVNFVIPAEHIHRIPQFSDKFLDYVYRKYGHTTRNRSSRPGQGSVQLHDEKLRPTERPFYLHN